jgi:hypothetical protein
MNFSPVSFRRMYHNSNFPNHFYPVLLEEGLDKGKVALYKKIIRFYQKMLRKNSCSKTIDQEEPHICSNYLSLNSLEKVLKKAFQPSGMYLDSAEAFRQNLPSKPRLEFYLT